MQKADLIAHIAPDILVLSGLDHDHGLATLTAFRDLITRQGHEFAHVFALPSNAGLLDRAGQIAPQRRRSPDDAQGYGHFRGERSLAILSRLPIDTTEARDFSAFLWRDLPGAKLPSVPPDRLSDQRLSSTGHWDVPVLLDHDRKLHLLIYQAGPPVFGPGDGWNRNRNHDETAFWLAYLDQRLPMTAPDAPVVLMGGSNLDPFDGDGLHQAMRRVLDHPRLQDPQPTSKGAIDAATTEMDRAQSGPPERDTVHWPQPNGPGNLRVSYILPDARLSVRDAAVFWPSANDPDAALLGDPDEPPTRHRLVWVDLDLMPP